jgi:hypothetical protein
MIGPQNRLNFFSFYFNKKLIYLIKSLYCWIDERGRKVKYSAPQYIELATTFIQRNISNENIFPTRLGKKFI